MGARAKTLLLFKNNIKTSKAFKKFTNGGAFVTKMAFSGKIVKETGYSDLEWGCLLCR